MNIGKFNIETINTGIFSLDGGAMFGVVPKTLWAKAYHPGDELNRIPLSARVLLVRWDNKILLIDTGNGDKMSDKFASLYNIDKEKSSIVPYLQKFNITPEMVDYVILTHLHFDHVGGATKYDHKGNLIPTFPNAKYFVQKEHLKWAENPTEKDRASFLKENYAPLIENNMLELLEGSGEIFPGISVLPLFGHTHSMQAIKITDNNQTLLYCADLCPTSAHIHIPFVMGYDNNPLQTIEEKKQIISQAYEERWILCYEHDAFVEASYVDSTDKGFKAGEKITISEKL